MNMGRLAAPMRLAPVLVPVLLLAGCAAPSAPAEADVVASFYPIEHLARRLAEPDLSVAVVVPPGVEPHDYEPSPGDLARIVEARLVLLQGASFEAWLENARAHAPDTRFATVGVVPDEHAQEAGHDEAEEDHPEDPHVWLDPVLYAEMARAVAKEIGQTFPAQADNVSARLPALLASLDALHGEWTRGLAACEKRVVVTNHDAFGYMAERYNFTTLSVSGLEPEAEPTPQAMQRVIEEMRRHDLRVIYFEELASPAVAQAIAREANATVRVLSPLEGPSDDAGATYESRMRENLEALREGMRCQ